MTMPRTIEDIFAAKAARRRRLASLSIDEKVDLIERLHDLGRTMVAARETLPADRRPDGGIRGCNPDAGR